MLTVNIITYFLIKIDIELTNRRTINLFHIKINSTWQKRIILAIAMIITWGIYLALGEKDYKQMVNACIFAPIFWSWILKPFFKKIGLSHKPKICAP
jgi:hypothetical protein